MNRAEAERREKIAMAICEVQRLSACACKRDGRSPAAMMTAQACIGALNAADAVLALPADDGWRPADSAPTNETIIVWGAGGIRFMRKDEHGQWRGMMGNPKDAPRFWQPRPSPPDDGWRG